ncbi:5'/3'-nucleotidase SurE [Candidatus Laterigemmans baculatus]|uniref:5'/3'-nucleotidase SurE n=1 Tax=Candidatus Laterigemmans baculatus TaxID=2770505 RepID=UPI0013DD4137|nr:5'/3'-nucleotidase SurE [Candidatus Laterigemmans baculatus]
MKILLTNDDGIDAPGLAALAATLAAETAIELLVVAPDRQRSECSHSVTTATPLQLDPRGEGRWAVNGTPVDCVRLALTVLAPDIGGVLAGVNEGANVGADVYMSGTAAAAREAAIRGVPAAAISHYRRPDVPRSWEHVPRWLAGRLLPLLTTRHATARFWNVNLPAVDPASNPAVVETALDRHPMPLAYAPHGDGLAYRVDYHNRPRQPGSDVAECFAGKISLTQLVAGF